MARPFTLFAVWLYLTLLAVGLCENGNFQTEGGGRALNLVVWSRLVPKTKNLFSQIIKNISLRNH